MRMVTMRMKATRIAGTIMVIMVGTKIGSTIMARTIMVITATVSSGRT